MTGSRLCPVCRGSTDAATCCGVALAAPFRMTTARIQALRRYAHGRKGLDEDAYRLNLRAVGAHSTTTLDRDQHRALMARLGRLPDAPRRTPVARAGQ